MLRTLALVTALLASISTAAAESSTTTPPAETPPPANKHYTALGIGIMSFSAFSMGIGYYAVMHSNLDDAWGIEPIFYRMGQLDLASGAALGLLGESLLYRDKEPPKHRKLVRGIGIGAIALGVAGAATAWLARDELGAHAFALGTISAVSAGTGTMLVVHSF